MKIILCFFIWHRFSSSSLFTFFSPPLLCHFPLFPFLPSSTPVSFPPSAFSPPPLFPPLLLPHPSSYHPSTFPSPFHHLSLLSHSSSPLIFLHLSSFFEAFIPQSFHSSKFCVNSLPLSVLSRNFLSSFHSPCDCKEIFTSALIYDFILHFI